LEKGEKALEEREMAKDISVSMELYFIGTALD
jgi:hypothetical protein